MALCRPPALKGEGLPLTQGRPGVGQGHSLAHMPVGVDLVLFEAEIVGVPPASWSQ